MKTCDICHRTEAETRLDWQSIGGTIQFVYCRDVEACNAYAFGTDQPAPPPPVDQLLRQRGFAELPGMGEAS